jgi:large subunit ribosomal protein L27
MAHKKGSGSTKNGRDSNPKYLGVKVGHAKLVSAGSILVRQRGSKFDPGMYVARAKDFSLFALIDGYVQFAYRRGKPTIHIHPISHPLHAQSHSSPS